MPFRRRAVDGRKCWNVQHRHRIQMSYNVSQPDIIRASCFPPRQSFDVADIDFPRSRWPFCRRASSSKPLQDVSSSVAETLLRHFRVYGCIVTWGNVGRVVHPTRLTNRQRLILHQLSFPGRRRGRTPRHHLLAVTRCHPELCRDRSGARRRRRRSRRFADSVRPSRQAL